MKTVLSLTCLALSVVAQANTIPFKSKISSHLANEIFTKSALSLNQTMVKIPVLVFMKEQADLTGADILVSKEEKGQFVYETLTEVAKKSQADLKVFLDAQSGIRYQQFHIVNMVAVYNATPTLIQELAKRPDVAKVQDDPTVQAQKPVSTGFSFQKQKINGVEQVIAENLTATKAPQVWNELNVKGEGIVVAGQDTGVEWNHPGLVKNYRGYNDGAEADHNYNWHDSVRAVNFGDAQGKCGIESAAPCDDNDHGTHTIGTVVGISETHTTGMAPAAKWIACRNMDMGYGTPSTYIDCFEWLLAPYKKGADAMVDGDPAKAPHVINNSWGCPLREGCTGTEMEKALVAMEKAGIMVVVSAGNEGPGCSSINDQPASLTTNVLSVGAYNHRDNSVAYFSSRGPSKTTGGIGPDVMAPGVNVLSTVPGGSYAGGGWSGTSMAGPHVAGLVALMWSANPKLIGDIKKTKSIITSTSIALPSTQSCGGIAGDAVPNNVTGHGMIDAYKAVKAALE
jgi:serine protease AprX